MREIERDTLAKYIWFYSRPGFIYIRSKMFTTLLTTCHVHTISNVLIDRFTKSRITVPLPILRLKLKLER